MKKIVAVALSVAAAMLLATCSVQSIPGPKYVPESVTIVGPEPKIPKEFVGCWRGTVNEFDSVTPLSPAISSSSIKALSTTYEFCFTKRPDGTGELALTDLEIGGRKGTVTHFDNRAVSIDPEFFRASLRNHTTVESAGYFLLIFPIHMTQDIYAEEELQMISPNLVSVKGKQLVVIGGNMIASMTFHANFDRVQSAPAASRSTTSTTGPSTSSLTSEFVVGTGFSHLNYDWANWSWTVLAVGG